MQRKRLNGLTITGLVLAFVAGPQVLIPFLQNEEQWWTPADRALSLAETRERFEVLVADTSLRKLLADGRLRIAVENAESVALTPDLLRVRLNNWPDIQARLLKIGLIQSFVFGVAVTLLVCGLLVVPRQTSEAVTQSQDAATEMQATEQRGD